MDYVQLSAVPLVKEDGRVEYLAIYNEEVLSLSEVFKRTGFEFVTISHYHDEQNRWIGTAIFKRRAGHI